MAYDYDYNHHLLTKRIKQYNFYIEMHNSAQLSALFPIHPQIHSCCTLHIYVCMIYSGKSYSIFVSCTDLKVDRVNVAQ